MIDDLDIKLHPPTLEPWNGGDDPEREIVVLMSGGVDSSVTAMLFRDTGWNVLGITMKIPVAERCDVQRSCCGIEAAYVARDLGIAHYYLDVRVAFEKLVIEPFREAYRRGHTPSPCVDCNTIFKFGLVWDFIEETFGLKHLATGHYARIVHEDNRAYLMRGEDRSRDQSYFLYGIPRRRLEYFHLPLGEMSKNEVRGLARKAKLPVARRQDSMELCFAGEGDYRNALGDIPAKGRILDSGGNEIGEHNGIMNYTVGQRKGIGIAASRPLYVIRISAADNSITVGTQEEAFSRDVSAGEVNVLIPELARQEETLYGKIRSQGEPSECEIVAVEEDRLSVRFNEPQFAPTPGQRLVLYDADGRVAAGGTIS